jgi:ABC-2 type transport system permease protein
MNELFYVIQREYLTRVRTRSFILVTLLTPLLLSLLFILPTYFARQHEDYKQLKIGLADLTHSMDGIFDESEFALERIENPTIDEIKNLILNNQLDGVIYVAKSDSIETSIRYYSGKQPSVHLLNQMKSAVQKVVVNEKLAVYGIPNVDEIIYTARSSISIENIRVAAEKAETVSSPYQRPLCLALGITIYMFVFMFSSQVMRGVLEEKSNRIVELIITSISPVKFMTGKIIGIALLGLTQIVCWMILMYGFTLFLSTDVVSSGSFVNQRISQDDVNQILENINMIDFEAIIPVFLFFFIGGYLLYSSIFAAISATANHSDEIQQITMIVTMPLMLSIIVLSNTVNSPDSSLSYWFSIVPFTSPVVMMGRVVYGAPLQDVILSMFLLLATVMLIVWLSGKVYRTAILYTGKKISMKEIISWIRNANN